MLIWEMKSIYGNHENEISRESLKLVPYDDKDMEPNNPHRLINYLQEMPFSMRIYFNGFIIDLYHSTPKGVNKFILLDKNIAEFKREFDFENNTSDIIFVGHTHNQFEKIIDEKKIVNPGALVDGKYCTLERSGKINFQAI